MAAAPLDTGLLRGENADDAAETGAEVNLRGRWSQRIGRRRLLRGAGFFGAGAALAWTLGCAGRGDEPLTTLDRTILLGEDGVLRYGMGEPHQVRTELAEARVNRERGRRSLVAFHHFADFQILDEESPLRGEWQDSCPVPLSTSAFRPQEALTLQVAASLIRAANRIDHSPLTDRPTDFVLHTGNAADNAHFNELRWFIDVMDGRRLQPDSGGPGYEGVQSESPDQRYPDLLALAQLPFVPEGIRYPWYTAVGSRDVLVQGNFPPSEASSQIALGEEKIIDISAEQKEAVCEEPSLLLDPERAQGILADDGTEVRSVTPDPGRRLLSRREWMAELFNSAESPGPLGHGFSQENLDDDVAYYVLEHGPLAFIVLDTVNPAGFAAGSIDATQFKWLTSQLTARSGRFYDSEGKLVEGEGADQLLVIVTHHSLDRLTNPLPDPSGKDRILGAALEELLHRFPNVIAHVTGSGHVNRVTARPDPLRRGGSYWEIGTGSPTAFPMQSRLLEVTDNRDGTISILGTIYDLDAPLDPGDARDPTSGDGVNESEVAAVARSLAAQDPQRDPEAAGVAASDRNVEMLLSAPFDLSEVATPDRHWPAAAAEPRRMSRRSLLRALLPIS